MTKQSQAGTSLIEVLIASFILTVVLLAVAMAMGAGVYSMFFTQELLIAKQKAREALESVFTARNTQNVTWADIRNVGGDGIFMDGFQPIREMGDDGIANTEDDEDEPLELLHFPGPDGELGTADDQDRPLSNFQRRITIGNVMEDEDTVDPDIRLITVDVRFQIRGAWHSISVSAYISRFA
ncbi:MAG: prepilin-type N-terminal cleavage/methylation domain-containing protein [Acidobacteria bacterium]|nr:prepilin-type N-terminal cleavage/methylation domain-containing protein [Acidobacteriota bacterium]